LAIPAGQQGHVAEFIAVDVQILKVYPWLIRIASEGVKGDPFC
jgi:hypothetical protein